MGQKRMHWIQIKVTSEQFKKLKIKAAERLMSVTKSVTKYALDQIKD